MNTPGIDQLLQELNSLASRAAGQDGAASAGTTDFGQALKSALDQAERQEHAAGEGKKE